MSSLELKLRLMQRDMQAYAPARPQVQWDAPSDRAACLVERYEHPVSEVCPVGFADIGGSARALLCGAQAQGFALERALFLDTRLPDWPAGRARWRS